MLFLIFLSSLFTIGRLHYKGGGDWYSNPSSLPNLLKFFSKVTGIPTTRREVIVRLDDSSYKKVSVIYFTGHGKFFLTPKERENLRRFLEEGGFLFADDNYGMDPYIRKELNQLFPGKKLTPLSLNFPIFHYPFSFPKGVPKIHRHYGGPPIAYGIFLKGRLVVFYAYNTDLGDGWEDPEVHGHTLITHQRALKMGVNVLWYAITLGTGYPPN